MPERVDTVVVGAGVVGLAIARALAAEGREVIVLERNAAIGMEISSRNSEVIHAGIYYAQNSFKARFCVDGKHQLYAYCDSHKVGHRRCGKLIVASDAGEPLHAAKRATGCRSKRRSRFKHHERLSPAAKAHLSRRV